ncbi:MBL fold metallo-hydrolase [Paenibacillus sp. 1011MAR3C5]|uniref:MBL fold metallo-hydrolase n=1 Tax=Paenibacillus sp. 1011MAR3C5 TaxID=1675787 RepID=UPI000E6C4A8E|nr:MBL fold metallo-hydrolase [Paenibacillus sp. 1011MAR3C5]RJE86126.1 MBL fold metallo-hydrolase [Paenibacillus sp. 1011MAR3C5]
MNIQLLRHATMRMEWNGKCYLLDPMLSPAGTFDATVNTTPTLRNPLVELPVPQEQAAAVDAVLVTHRHPDHWDEAASALLSRKLPILCQSEDVEAFVQEGFAQVHGLAAGESGELHDLRVSRTGGHHGYGAIGHAMGTVSGFVLDDGMQKLYIAGDTVWCEEVGGVLDQYKPDVTVLFAGEARFVGSGAITMGLNDIIQVLRRAPRTKVVIAHMEAWNHCGLTRESLQRDLALEGFAERVFIPADGEMLEL